MKRIALAIAVVGLLAIGGATAEAGHGPGRGVSIRIGYGGYGRYPAARQSYYRGYGGNYWGGQGGWGHSGHGHGHASWHDTSHYDYHPGGFYRHGNHLHYQPGHYDWHDDGHWDHH